MQQAPISFEVGLPDIFRANTAAFKIGISEIIISARGGNEDFLLDERVKDGLLDELSNCHRFGHFAHLFLELP